MAETIFARAIAKWRGLLVYILLYYAFRFVSDWIFYQTFDRGWRVYAICLELAACIYCVWQEWLLVSRDCEGDEGWPPIWA